MRAQVLGPALLGPIDDPAVASWARDQLSRTTLPAAMSAIQAACEFTSSRWIGQNDEWKHDASVDWHLLDYPEHAGVQAMVRALNTIYRSEPALWEQDVTGGLPAAGRLP